MIVAIVLDVLCSFEYALLCFPLIWLGLGYFKSQKSNYLQSCNSRLIRLAGPVVKGEGV